VEVTDAGGRLLGWGGEEAPPGGLPGREPPTRAGADGVELLEVAAVLRLPGEHAGWVRVGLRPEAVQGVLSRHQLRLWMTTSLLAAVGLFAIGLLYRVQVRHHRALGELQERLARARRLSALGRLGAALAHEIRNPLNALGLGLQRIQRELLPPEGEPREAVGRLTALMRDEVRRLDALVGEFLAASPETRGAPVLFPVAEVVRQTLALLEEEARARGVRVEARIPEAALRVLGDGDKLRQALLNLLRNALEAIPGEGEVRVVVDVPEARRVRIRVQDSGAGIPREDRERIFDPAFTTKEKGLGLGLAVAHEIVNAHGGELRVASRVGGGTAVDVWLPLAG
ncbi:MAG: sensor histidine kinase, partial [Deferrisomatales bacterium]